MEIWDDQLLEICMVDRSRSKNSEEYSKRTCHSHGLKNVVKLANHIPRFQICHLACFESQVIQANGVC